MQLLHIKRQIKILNITKVCSSKIHREAVPKFGAIMAENSLTTFFLEYFECLKERRGGETITDV